MTDQRYDSFTDSALPGDPALRPLPQRSVTVPAPAPGEPSDGSDAARFDMRRPRIPLPLEPDASH